MGKNPILSICIPTNGIVEWVIPVVESIYAQGVDNDLFEVVITDNGGKDDLEKAIQAYDYPNLHYYKTTAQGFTNQIDAFEKCSGLFCKMLNHRSRLLSGSLHKIIAIVEKYQKEKPILYFAEGRANGGVFIECNNVDSFVGALSYYVSWSAGVGAWKEDLNDIRGKNIDKMFPHTVFLFGLRDESKYVIWNDPYEVMGNDSGKGGYDLYYTFSIVLLDIINGLRQTGRISLDTFVKVKKELFVFLRGLYISEAILPTHRTFILQNIPQSMDVYYGRLYYWKMVIGAWLRIPLTTFRRCLSHLYSFFRL